MLLHLRHRGGGPRDPNDEVYAAPCVLAERCVDSVVVKALETRVLHIGYNPNDGPRL